MSINKLVGNHLRRWLGIGLNPENRTIKIFSGQSRTLFPICLFLAVITSCAPDVYRHYSGHLLPMDQIAVLIVSSGISVEDVDQEKIPYATSGIFSRKLDYIEIIPGLHVLSLKHVGDTLFHQLRFDALPGHIYAFRYTIEKNTWQAWIVDVTESYKDYLMKKLR